MDYETIRREERGENVWITLDRPPDNRISTRMVDELEQVIHRIEDDSPARAVVFRGGGACFSRGIDLRDFPADAKPDVYGFSRWEKMIRALERLPKITIAAIDGECAGGGVHIALACDVRVATMRSTLCLHEARMGFLPGMAVFRLAKFIGLGRSRRMALTGRTAGAAEAERIGLVDHVVPDGSLFAGVSAALSEFGDFHPEAVELIKRLLNESFAPEYEDYLGGFLAAQHRAIQTEAFRRLVRLAHEDK